MTKKSEKKSICLIYWLYGAVFTMNLREWLHFFKLRTFSNVHPQMREIAMPLLKEFQKQIPVVFDGIKNVQ
jgi:thymidylate synthase ThyX